MFFDPYLLQYLAITEFNVIMSVNSPVPKLPFVPSHKADITPSGNKLLTLILVAVLGPELVTVMV